MSNIKRSAQVLLPDITVRLEASKYRIDHGFVEKSI